MYEVIESYKGLTAYPAKGAVKLDKASQADLKLLFDMKYQGVIKVDKKPSK